MAHSGFPIIQVGVKTVTTAGTRVQLSTSSAHKNLHAVFIQADDGNGANVIFIGGSSVAAANYVRRLLINETFDIIGDLQGFGNIDATSLWLDASANTQSVQWGYL